MSAFSVTLESIKKAQAALAPLMDATPLLKNSWLSEQFGAEIYLKMENMQPIGSFKIRGATYFISQLTAAEKARGVIAASAGNHAQGVAWGSRALGVDALIVMPTTAPIIKVQNTRRLGAKIHLEGESYDEAYTAAQRLIKETGRVYVHAFKDPQVIAGQGVIGLELMSQCPGMDIVVGSMGGGGMMAGMAIALKELKPSVRIIGCQASGAPSMIESLRAGKAITLARTDTFADGIRVAAAAEEVRELLTDRVDELLSADDEAMAMAILELVEKAKVLCEGAAALPLAVLDQIRDEVKGKKVVLVLSGGNLDVNVLSRIIDRGLMRAGRRLRVNVLISDRPGSLARLTALIAEHGASVLQAIHDRNEPTVRIDQTDVELTLETRGPEHGEEILRALEKHAIKIHILS
jgi:threonine dehydratase